MIFTIVQPVFLRAANLLDILEAVSVTALLGLGITVSLAVGGFDLSVGSTAAMGVMTAAYAEVVWGWGAAPTVLLVLGVGVTVGLFNSLLIIILRVPDLLATLGTLFLVGGLQLIPSGGNSISTGMVFEDGSTANGVFSPYFLMLGRERLRGMVRHAVWADVLKANPCIHQVGAWGTANNPVATNVADQTAAVFRAHPDISVIFAPWDEFVRGASLAVDENKLNGHVKIYSAGSRRPTFWR